MLYLVDITSRIDKKKNGNDSNKYVYRWSGITANCCEFLKKFITSISHQSLSNNLNKCQNKFDVIGRKCKHFSQCVHSQLTEHAEMPAEYV